MKFRALRVSIFVSLLVLAGIMLFYNAQNGTSIVSKPAIHSPTTLGATTSTPAAATTAATQNAQQVAPASSTVVSNATPPQPALTSLLLHMHLTFADEFNSFSPYADAKGNSTCYSGGSGTWQTVYAFCSRTNHGNAEAEIYTDPSFFAYLKKETLAEAAKDPGIPFSVSDGVLQIKAAPSEQQVQTGAGAWAKYTSGLITTQYSFTQTYGYFEMRAKFPVGAGLWPAFWLLPADKSWPPEVDVVEAFGAPNAKGEGGTHFIHYASHAPGKGTSCGEWYDTGVDLTGDFHTYGVDFESTGITYYFDGVAYATCPPNPAGGKPFYMLVNLAVGGPGSWPGVPNASTSWPAYISVDYVRAYQKN